jgi:hypothetical protein
MHRTNSIATTGGEATAPLGDSTTQFRDVTEDGVDYLVAPVVAQVEDVYAYRTNDGITREYLPGDELTAPVDEWEGVPLLLRHPTDASGRAVLTDHPEADPVEVGAFREVRANDGTLPGEVWIRQSEVGDHDGELESYIERVNAGGYGEVSTGYDLRDIEQTSGRHNGQPYDAVQRGVQPDHLALLVDNEGNCPVEAGECGVGRANQGDGADHGHVRTNHTLRNPRLHAAPADDGPDSAVERLAARLNQLLGGTAAPTGTDTDRDETAATETTEQPSDEPAESGRDTTDTSDSNMHDDDKIDELVELGYDRANLEAWKGEDCLARLHEQATADDGTDADADADDTTEDEPEQTDTTSADGTTEDEVDVEALAAEVAAHLDIPSPDDLADEVEQARANQKNIETVVNSDSHPFDRDDLEAMDPDHVAKLAEQADTTDAPDTAAERANMAGMPTGPSVDLGDDADDGLDDSVPAGGALSNLGGDD